MSNKSPTSHGLAQNADFPYRTLGSPEGGGLEKMEGPGSRLHFAWSCPPHALHGYQQPQEQREALFTFGRRKENSCPPAITWKSFLSVRLCHVRPSPTPAWKQSPDTLTGLSSFLSSSPPRDQDGDAWLGWGCCPQSLCSRAVRQVGNFSITRFLISRRGEGMEAWRSTRSPAWKVRSRKPEDKYDRIAFGVKGIPAFLFSLQANLKTFNKDQNVLWNRCSTNKDDMWRKNVHTVLHLHTSPENSGKQTPPSLGCHQGRRGPYWSKSVGPAVARCR